MDWSQINDIQESIPPAAALAEQPASLEISISDTDLKELLKEIKGLQELVKYMYSQNEMDEVLAINTRLEEENIRLKSQK
tara:strand:- start:485 stop:724 length:240 start_codon:yes stop_codon:yes gene_type:complete